MKNNQMNFWRFLELCKITFTEYEKMNKVEKSRAKINYNNYCNFLDGNFGRF